ncbi:hypothetical protein [Xanthobacter autotrophicus]|uniref:hypothetical protein n=1 Tax=Xanthobacter autotrophicus TaxID=280 RepID=UPI00372B564C
MTVVASNYARKENDLYQTEPWATEALLRVLPPLRAGHIVWEPAAGNHLIADVVREASVPVVTSDIAIYDRPHDFLFDFLSGAHDGPDATHIITNPPYGRQNRDAEKFAALALSRCRGWVALLLTAKFDFGKTRAHLFRDCPRFFGKIALVDRIQWFAGDGSGTEDHAWYIWAPTGEAHPHGRIFYEGNPAKPARQRKVRRRKLEAAV